MPSPAAAAARSIQGYINYDGLVMSNLWLLLMDRMGVVVERHGDNTGRLTALSA